MATAHFFSKDGTKMGQVTDSGVTGWQCDYIDGGTILMASNSNIIRIGQISATQLQFHTALTVNAGSGTNLGRGVCHLPGVNGVAYALFRSNS